MTKPKAPDYRLISEIHHLPTLRSRIHQATGVEAIQGTEGVLEQLPHTLAAAAHAALTLVHAEKAAIESVRASRTWDGKSVSTFQLENAEYDPAAFAVDNFLDAARRTQNAVWPYLSKVLRRSIPQSLADLLKRINAHPDFLPQRITQLLCDYWTSSGQRLKDYRDLAEHHAVVSSDGRVTLLPDGREVIYLVLPNNPFEKEPRKLAYLDPRIDALPYVWENYWVLYSFIFELTHLLLSYTTEPALEVIPIVFKGTVRMGGPTIDAHELVQEEILVSNFLKGREELKKRLDAELPRKGIKPTLIISDEDAFK